MQDLCSRIFEKMYGDESFNKMVGDFCLKDDKNLKNTGTCLTLDENVKEPGSGATLDVKTWGDAWKEGPLQGLITFPIAFGLISFTNMIGASGVGQILSILIVTIIVRLLITLATFKTTMQQQKMTLLQPELNAIQVKYNGRTDQISKQKMFAGHRGLMRNYPKFHFLRTLFNRNLATPIGEQAPINTPEANSGTVFRISVSLL